MTDINQLITEKNFIEQALAGLKSSVIRTNNMSVMEKALIKAQISNMVAGLDIINARIRFARGER